MSEETKVKVDDPQSSAQDNVLRLISSFLGPSMQQEEKRRVRIKEEQESDCDEETTDEETDSDSDDTSGLEDEEWETLKDLVESHRKLCQAFSLLLETKRRD